ncbi:MAG TPA: hypothetical protein VKB57_13990 [Acidimicrobiales bacterium]|nr:hypothetical protein [Acidimicrobiales bacterium]
MHPSPTHRRFRPAGLAAAALAVTLAFGAVACGDDGGGSASGSDFCGSMKSLASKFKDTSDLDASSYKDLLDSLDNVQPPAQLKDDWATFLKSRDLIDHPDQATAEQGQAITTAADKIDKYLKDTCKLDV